MAASQTSLQLGVLAAPQTLGPSEAGGRPGRPNTVYTAYTVYTVYTVYTMCTVYTLYIRISSLHNIVLN